MARKDAVLTHQAGVRQQTRSVVLLLAAAGALLGGLAVVLELCPARPVGATTCHPSFIREWMTNTAVQTISQGLPPCSTLTSTPVDLISVFRPHGLVDDCQAVKRREKPWLCSLSTQSSRPMASPRGYYTNMNLPCKYFLPQPLCLPSFTFPAGRSVSRPHHRQRTRLWHPSYPIIGPRRRAFAPGSPQGATTLPLAPRLSCHYNDARETRGQHDERRHPPQAAGWCQLTSAGLALRCSIHRGQRWGRMSDR